MDKQKKQLMITIILLLVLVAGYFGVKAYNQNQNGEEETESESYILTVIDSDGITSFSYYVEDVLLKYVKSGDEWKYEEDDTVDLDESSVTTLLLKICAITSDTCIADYDTLKEYGLDEPQDTITITTEQGDMVLHIGNENAFDGGYYVMLDNDTNVYMISGTVVDAFDATVEDLTVEVETETESSTETTE